ncbi:hypothetical protein KDA23_02955 [Candidatus Saccharibacteria bacterium]|nr:hypothetical protein [Candidatus Saccharibacteria bacterium]
MFRSAMFGVVSMAAPLVVLAHAVPTHQNITKAAVEYLQQLDDRAVCLSNLEQLLQVGTAAEDEGTRPVFHFTPALSAAGSSCSSVDWGLGSGTCEWFGGEDNNTHRWSDAIDSATAANGGISEEGLTHLGYVLHLLEDLTSPAHTRNDQHLNKFGVGDIDPVEAVTRTPTSPATSEGLADVSSPVSFFVQLRTYTASNFYSKDTVFSDIGPKSVREDTEYFYDARDRRIAYKSLAYRTKELFGVTPDPKDATINDVIAKEQFEELGPIAVRYAASLIKHYFDVTNTTGNSGCFVDFEKFSGPSVFSGVQLPLASEGATFSGGQILSGATFLPRNASVVYGTAFFCPGCSPTITIDMATPINGVRMLLMNGQTFNVSYVVEDDNGGTSSVTLPPNSASGSAIVEIPSQGIRRVTVRSNVSAWDFFIDNITLGIGTNGTAQIRSVQVTPETRRSSLKRALSMPVPAPPGESSSIEKPAGSLP